MYSATADFWYSLRWCWGAARSATTSPAGPCWARSSHTGSPCSSGRKCTVAMRCWLQGNARRSCFVSAVALSVRTCVKLEPGGMLNRAAQPSIHAVLLSCCCYLPRSPSARLRLLRLEVALSHGPDPPFMSTLSTSHLNRRRAFPIFTYTRWRALRPGKRESLPEGLPLALPCAAAQASLSRPRNDRSVTDAC